ncbi:insulinase family protein [Candidatus Wolfebacteria bacterium]|nr:insulinase family protein [Candidatus Wolfebacteria bacterium]
MNIYKESKTSNKITVITSENKNSEIINISFLIRSGSCYEQLNQRGYAHLLEHMLLRGTKNKPSFFDISCITDRSGAFFNAYTDIEIVKLVASVVKESFEDIFNLMTDIITNPLLDVHVLENEKKVVVQELKRAFDNRESRIRIESIKNTFKGHSLSNFPLGEEKDIIGATAKDLKNYYEEFFRPDRMAIIATGNINHNYLVKLIENQLGNWGIGDSQINNFINPKLEKRNIFIEMPGTQTHLALNFLIPKSSLEKNIIFNIIANYLGYGHTSLLYREIRHKLGLAYSISVSNYFYSSAGIFSIITSTTFPKKTIDLLLDRTQHVKNYLNNDLFSEYQQQVVNIGRRQFDNSFDEMNFLGLRWGLYGRLVTLQEVEDVIMKISFNQLIETTEKYLNKSNFVLLALGEKNPF